MTIADIEKSAGHTWSYLGELNVRDRDPATVQRIFAVVESTGLGAPAQAILAGRSDGGVER